MANCSKPGRNLRVLPLDDSHKIHDRRLEYGAWFGSTNIDNRSFGLNDEVNLAVFDERLAARLEEDFARDVAGEPARLLRRVEATFCPRTRT
jgi:phosphatidylserine/phosphatidylglycerophosphate/cardiolipin synthase-like enzyme